WLTPDQLRSLLDEILDSKKTARGWCPTCKKRVSVEVADATAVVKGLTELGNQGFGRPREAKADEGERITFERVVYLGDDERLEAAEAKLAELGWVFAGNTIIPIH